MERTSVPLETELDTAKRCDTEEIVKGVVKCLLSRPRKTIAFLSFSLLPRDMRLQLLHPAYLSSRQTSFPLCLPFFLFPVKQSFSSRPFLMRKDRHPCALITLMMIFLFFNMNERRVKCEWNNCLSSFSLHWLKSPSMSMAAAADPSHSLCLSASVWELMWWKLTHRGVGVIVSGMNEWEWVWEETKHSPCHLTRVPVCLSLTDDDEPHHLDVFW